MGCVFDMQRIWGQNNRNPCRLACCNRCHDVAHLIYYSIGKYTEIFQKPETLQTALLTLKSYIPLSGSVLFKHQYYWGAEICVAWL